MDVEPVSVIEPLSEAASVSDADVTASVSLASVAAAVVASAPAVVADVDADVFVQAAVLNNIADVRITDRIILLFFIFLVPPNVCNLRITAGNKVRIMSA